MTFREKLIDMIADSAFVRDSNYGGVKNLVITKHKKDAEELLREFRGRGNLFTESFNAAMSEADDDQHSDNSRSRVRRRFENAYVRMCDLKIEISSCTVYIFPEKDAEFAVQTIVSSGVRYNVIVDESCSQKTRFLASEPSEDAVADITAWIDSIPVV